MFEKLLLALTITFSLSLFISFSTQSSSQGVVTHSTTDTLIKTAEIPQNHILATRRLD